MYVMAYEAGYEDYWAGYELNENPFFYDQDYWDWEEGWLDAEEENYRYV